MSTPVIALDHPAAIDAARVGHEAAALAVARAAGLPTVPGLVLTADWAAHDRRTAEMVWRITSHDGHRPLVVRPSDVVRRRHQPSEPTTTTPTSAVCDVDDLLAAATSLRAGGHGSRPLLLYPDAEAAWRGALFVDECVGRRSSSPVVVACSTAGVDEWVASLDDTGRIREQWSAAASPSPSARILTRLARLAARTADAFEGPQDLEWTADDDGRVGLVRIRPIVHLRTTATACSHRVDGRQLCRAPAVGRSAPGRPRSIERTRGHDRRVA